MTIPTDNSPVSDLAPAGQLETQVGERLFKVKDNFYRISLPTGYKVGDANAWLIDGDSPILFDTGTGNPESIQALETALGCIGRSIKDIKTILLTHAHIDHCGAAGSIFKIAGCPVHVHPAELARVRDFHTASRIELNKLYPIMLLIGFSEESCQKGSAILAALTAAIISCPSATELPLEIESSIGTITWHHVPGHSGADVVFMIKDAGLAILGDHILSDVTPSPALSAEYGLDYVQAFFRYRESLKWSAQLSGYLGCPGHGTTFSDMGKRVQEIFEGQTARYEKVIKILNRLGPATILQITGGLFGTKHSWEILMLAAETAGYVNMMEAAGLCRIEHTAGRPDMVIPLQIEHES
jgi:glyoxylase-like metal-dependent hydrolase (beta-lactamase superfamily II)